MFSDFLRVYEKRVHRNVMKTPKTRFLTFYGKESIEHLSPCGQNEEFTTM